MRDRIHGPCAQCWHFYLCFFLSQFSLRHSGIFLINFNPLLHGVNGVKQLIYLQDEGNNAKLRFSYVTGKRGL